MSRGGNMGLIRSVGALAVGGVAIFAGTGGFDDNTTRNDQGEIVEPGGLGAFTMRVGDCVQVPAEEMVESMEAVPCAEPHDAQVFAKFDVADAPEYGQSRVDDEAGQGCYERWSSAIGTVYEEDAELDIQLLTPTSESWGEGDREVVCMVVSIDGLPLRGSRLR